MARLWTADLAAVVLVRMELGQQVRRERLVGMV
jgi:hypothetical protein